MTYNTQREQLQMREYGRLLQDMVDECLTIEERDERQRCAETIVRIMATLHPNTKQMPDYGEKLWNHLAHISGYRLDIDYPYPITRSDAQAEKPKPLKYPMQRIRFRHYGHITEAFMHQIVKLEDAAERERLTAMMANYMKRSLYNWHRDAMDDGKVEADIAAYTEGMAQLPADFRFASATTGHLPGNKKKKRR